MDEKPDYKSVFLTSLIIMILVMGIILLIEETKDFQFDLIDTQALRQQYLTQQ